MSEVKQYRKKLVVTWIIDNRGGWSFYSTLPRAIASQAKYGGYIYRIERDEDGSNPTIKLVETGGCDE